MSIFIVLGLILLISASIFFFYKTRTAVFNPEQITEIQSTPITSYVDVCVKYGAYEALDKLGRQGGYLYFPPEIELNPNAYVSQIPGTTLLKIPYWYYNSVSRVPTIEQIEKDLSIYVTKYAYDCVDEFSVFYEQYNVNILENISVNARITQKTVQFDTSYPVDILKKSNNQKIELRDYKTTVNVRLIEALEMVTKVMKSNYEQGFLENTTLRAIMLEPDAPLNGIAFGYSREEWSVRDINDKVYDFLYLLFASKLRFRFDDSQNPFILTQEKTYEDLENLDEGKALAGEYRDVSVPKDFYEYKHLYFKVFENGEYSGLTSSIDLGPKNYFLLNIQPNKNGKVYSNTQTTDSNFALGLLPIQFWHFLYDVYYPVIIRAVDPLALDNRGFELKAAYPVYLKQNLPAPRSPVSFESFKWTPTSDICDETQSVARTVVAYTRNASLINGLTGEPMPIKDVEIYYECPQGTCYKGKTEFVLGSFGIELELPKKCSNGVITAKSPGFIDTKVQAVSTENEFYVDMVPLKNFTYSIEVYTDYMSSDVDSDGNVDLIKYNPNRFNKNYTFSIHLKSYNNTHEEYIILDSIDGNSSSLELANINSKYLLDIYLSDDEDNIIGGYFGNLSISAPTPYDFTSDFDTLKSHVTFKVYARVPMVRTDDEYVKLFDDLEKNSYNYLEQLKPVFS